ncbi:hypothetical protein [Tranquillimonas alkanivorans]|uniref:PH domain-containing protein n=1 Tax=Tranquillimonas alkanivorans TaxID=441119 RepID=A0A1I5SLY9_9RHOB|nr:hypothetical protein [Tranquillimonas alkanivorans]SFP71742.1 hypothetical protein SAMN04488047_11186 [Tranquillimonas alkanivorans]
MSDVLARLRPSAPRRVFGTGVLALLGVLLAWLALTTDPAMGWRIALLAISAAALWLAVRLWQATAGAVELTAEGLRDTDGTPIAPLAAIEGLDRGAFAFKPSNGFLVRLDTPGPRAWAPGLWWRLGRRVGIGGVTSASEAKFMAELLSGMVADRRE